MLSLVSICSIICMISLMLVGFDTTFGCISIGIFSVLIYIDKSGKISSIHRYINENRLFCWCVGAAILFLWGGVLITLGKQKNADVLKIKEQGIKTTAKITAIETKFRIVRTDAIQEIYYVKFNMDGKDITGKAVSKAGYGYIPGKEVDIYYMPYSAGDVINVAFADITDEPGNNQIGHGFWLMYFGFGFIIGAISCLRENRLSKEK